MISERERQQIREIFDRDLVNDVTLEVFTRKPSPLFIPGRQESASGPETEALVREVGELSDKLQVEVHDLGVEPDAAAKIGLQHVPAVVLRGSNAGTVRFLGVPAGYEFSALIADIVDLSKGEIGLSEATLAELAGITEPVHIQVFSTPT